MNEINTISEFLDLSPGTFKYVLKGKRNLSFKKAQKLGRLLKCDLNLWQDPERITERKDEWKKYCEEETV